MVGSENVFEIQVINLKARDLMVDRLYQFIYYYTTQLQEEEEDEHMVFEQEDMDP